MFRGYDQDAASGGRLNISQFIELCRCCNVILYI